MSSTRRDFLKMSAAAAIASALAPLAKADDLPLDPYMTVFYQQTREAIEAMGKHLPSGEDFIHIFTESYPGLEAHTELARIAHDQGPSFKTAMALDAHKYKNWQSASDQQLSEWAKEFREVAREKSHGDFWAFNELPAIGVSSPEVRDRAARWTRMICGEPGKDQFRCVFYLTEKITLPWLWRGEADEFWKTLDECCVSVGGEHFHSYPFVMDRPVAELTDHIMALPRWLMKSGKPPQMNVASKSYTILHSSFYGRTMTAWAGLQTDKYSTADLEKFLRRCIEATRADPLGKSRICFSPLQTRDLDPNSWIVLAKVLGEDAKRYQASMKSAK